MTTIAANREMIVCDSLVTCEGLLNYTTTKLYRIGGSIFGASGDTDAIAQFMRWVKSDRSADALPDFDDDADLAVLELRPDGIWLWDTGLFPDRIEDAEQNYAVGSGDKVALYCMRVLGMSPTEAVVEVCKIDTHSGPPVRWMKLDGSEGVIEC